MVSQLSLFEIAETGSFYKPGDWVKIRKTPAIAKHVKCGHIYKIHAVDPTDGGLQFWNPFASQWDYLYPSEVKLALPPTDKNDSVTPVEPAVTESILPTCETNAIAQLDAVGESNLPPREIDSPTPAEVAVGESTDPLGDDSFTLNAISTYKPRGTARSGEYYRLSYKDGGKVRQVHIRGGNTDSPIAQAKVQEVRSLLAAGIPPAEIAATLRSSGGVKKTFLS
ncbi:hypothetical protein [Microcoleus asticus]|uniref:Uncharacterized protein n=1 Tax=Microcoleus asticus IPMA8 TaxID=2563858 RepID=A0ABX2D4E8_9CYAN|nr:hypothetical protein [Microcoleus asticus]NQE37526.1 hypothetical protein [Microcoleus asticus IPMA8]